MGYLINTPLGRKLVSKLVTKLLRKGLKCDGVKTHFTKIDGALDDGDVVLRVDVIVRMPEEELMRLIDQKVEEL
ncbi:MAG: hypothetical protein IKO52_10510 [Clostridia bacterium]|nr:hypothetical protein [Clostridia bacterium]